ncbi:ParB N-terminal domain-containing protein [Treponema sp.]|uniref:ParB N-terminal domain-containing protein n=1 Tax=Treponema sp. TaxID=166 RepID=UPI001D1C07E0|nr:ParB N-terminal domain-containing protein [Treponema sp.]MBS7241110.1 ParB N-terminal domain-containing protein [Treponema sp.]MCI6442090.1 ParB N-terminal domain-containing protein [Spirochaetia bacterium]MDY4132773.1 ParB N-terminal domain-containing protein [Treponema sp.]
MIVKIDDIKIKKRVRRDLGDLEALKDSLKQYGLMNPITLNSKYELVAGERRLEAAKSLGWERINAIVLDKNVDKLCQLEMELEENNQRKEFTDDELLEGYKRLERLRNPSILMRILTFIANLFVAIAKKIAKLFMTPKE